MIDVQGHRGARGLMPENTLPGFARALELGVSTLEMDMAVTRDGVVVVSHDQCLNPDHTRDEHGRFIAGPRRPIFSLSLDELRRYDVGRLKPGTAYAERFPGQAGFDRLPIPTLAEVFALVREAGDTAVRFNIETKINPYRPKRSPGPEAFVDAFLATVRAAGVAERVILQSFDWRTLRYARRVAPEIATSCLTIEQPIENNIRRSVFGASRWLGGLDARDFASVPQLVKAADAAIWSPDATTLTPVLVAEAKALGLGVLPWTVNDPGAMAYWIDAGVDGLISDRPDVLLEVVRAKGLRPLGRDLKP